MSCKFRFTPEEAEETINGLKSGRIFDCSPAIWREIGELTRLGKDYPYRKVKP